MIIRPLQRVAFFWIHAFIRQREAAFAQHNAFTLADEFNSTQRALATLCRRHSSCRLLLGVAALCIVASSAVAENTPRRGPLDNRVRIATWAEGQVYRVVTTLTRVTTVEFGTGETIQSIIAGDTVGFQFDGVPGGRAFAIKPTASGVATNITVYTNRRSYYFHVVEARETPHYVVQFRYPETQTQPTRAVAADAPNANYAVSSQKEFTPTAVWDDGTFTYFRFARNAPVPAIFRYSNGAERAVNSTAQADGVIRVSGVNQQWVLRLGEDEVCVQDSAGPAS